MRQHDWQSMRVALSNFRGQVSGPAMADGVTDGLQAIYVVAQSYIPGSGPLSQSMVKELTKYDPPREVRGKVSMWGANGQLPYAWMREEGGTIRPKPTNPTGRLWWVNEDGELICARQVTQQGSHYMRRAAEETRDDTRARIMSAVTGRYVLFD